MSGSWIGSRCVRSLFPAHVLRVLVVLLACYMCCYLIKLKSAWLFTRGSHLPPQRTHNLHISPCPNLLSGMSQGRWVRHNVSWERTQELRNYVTEVRSQYKLPVTMQRDDGKCGNVSFALGMRSDTIMHFFRGTCNPDGHAPCCRNGSCMSASLTNCHCPTCVDLRQEVHAEAASWTSEDSRCAPRRFTPEGACRVLAGSTLVLAGDSLVRQLYVSFLLMLTGNFRYGALGPNITKDARERCSGLHQYTGKECRHFIPSSRSLCHGTVTLVFIPCPRAVHVQYLLEGIKSLPYSSRTFLVFSIGLHDSFNALLVRTKFLLPVMRYLEQSRVTQPDMLWLTTHAFGTLSFAPERSDAIVKGYNSDITHFLEQSGLPVLDVHSLTPGVVSPDGVHFGHGVNDVKMRMILTYLYHRRLDRHW